MHFAAKTNNFLLVKRRCRSKLRASDRLQPDTTPSETVAIAGLINAPLFATPCAAVRICGVRFCGISASPRWQSEWPWLLIGIVARGGVNAARQSAGNTTH